LPFHPVHHYYSAGDWIWSIFSTLLFIAFVVAVVMLLARAFAGPRRGGPGVAGPFGGRVSRAAAAAPAWLGAPAAWRDPGAGTAAAESILAARYARGEISEAEYRERLEVLRQAAAPASAYPATPPSAYPATPPSAERIPNAAGAAATATTSEPAPRPEAPDQ
jgi:uncharacterized membrane protein